MKERRGITAASRSRADLPRIEANTNPPCQRHLSNPADPNPGQDCVNPPKGADFYPFSRQPGRRDATKEMAAIAFGV